MQRNCKKIANIHLTATLGFMKAKVWRNMDEYAGFLFLKPCAAVKLHPYRQSRIRIVTQCDIHCQCVCVYDRYIDMLCLFVCGIMSLDVHQSFGASPCSPGHAHPSAQFTFHNWLKPLRSIYLSCCAGAEWNSHSGARTNQLCLAIRRSCEPTLAPLFLPRVYDG